MLPDRVSSPGPLTYESGALPIALRGPANDYEELAGECSFGNTVHLYVLSAIVSRNTNVCQFLFTSLDNERG